MNCFSLGRHWGRVYWKCPMLPEHPLHWLSAEQMRLSAAYARIQRLMLSRRRYVQKRNHISIFSSISSFLAALGQRCTIDANCSAVQFSKCAENRCCCNEGFVAVGKRCLSIAKSINDGCELDEQCQETLGGSARCEGGFCQCRELYQLKASSNKCVRDMRE